MPFYFTFFYATTSLLLFLTGLAIFLKNFQSSSNKSLLFFIGNMILYMASIYLGYYFINPEDPELSTFFIRMTFIFGLFFTVALTSFSYFYPSRTVNFPEWAKFIFILVAVLMAGISGFTDLIYEKEIIINGSEIEDVHGKLHNLFLLHVIFNSGLAIWISLKKIYLLKGIEKSKTWLSLIGISTVVFTIILFHAILPKFEIYWLQTEVVFFSLVFVVLSFYSMLKYRFLDIKFTISRTAKNIVAVFIAVLLCQISYLILIEILSYNQLILGNILLVAFAILIYQMLIHFFNSDTFHRMFWITSVEYFNQLIDEFQYENKEFKSINELELALDETFKQKFKIKNVNLITLNHHSEFPRDLINFFQKNTELLVTAEIPFKKNKEANELFKELKSYGEIFLPLKNASKNLVGILVLGKQQFNDIYTANIIKRLIKFHPYLKLQITSILYKEALKLEVEKKTESLNQKNKQLKKSYKELKKMDEVKDEFLAIASHELRTPLSIIKGYTDFLLQEKFGKINEKQTDFLGKIFRSTDSLLDLINKMLDISHIESGKMEFKSEVINIFPYLNHIKEEFSLLFKNKKIKLGIKNPQNLDLKIFVDPEKLHIIFTNLLGNAYKFTPPKGEVIIEVTRKSKRFIKVSVIDNGIGIPKEKHKYIFKKFQQVENSLQKEYTGTGLGLNITEKIIKKFGGRIWVEGLKKNKSGTNFSFTLPMKIKK